GTGLFSTATEWARGNGFRQLAVETQNTNVPACKFYASQGCKLGEIDRFKYITHPSIAHETMLVWYLDL
ncbi:MAG: hypothetical protein Q8O43_07245, partial [Dehalococcoidia bacterium]|nr:hypothetical protein [Dehalococcoidia bacterium]